MRPGRWPGLTATLVAVLLACVLVPAVGAAPRPAVFDLVSLTTSAHSSIPPGVVGVPKDKTPTSEVTEVDRLYNAVPQFGRGKGAQVGSDHTTLVHFGPTKVWASVVTKLPGGLIYVRGYARSAAGQLVIAVIGGTGRYAHARGMLTVRDLNAPGLALNVYRLTL